MAREMETRRNEILLLFGSCGITLIGYGLPAATAADAQRQHDAHVHGAGTLNLVQEGQQLHIDLDIPGMDIVGFEYKARTTAQKQTVKEAVAALKRGGDLFQMNAEAKCALQRCRGRGLSTGLMLTRTTMTIKTATSLKPRRRIRITMTTTTVSATRRRITITRRTPEREARAS